MYIIFFQKKKKKKIYHKIDNMKYFKLIFHEKLYYDLQI